MYAGVAARAALALSAYDAVLADTYQSSALAAMAYAERNYEPERYTDGKKLHHVADQRNLSALELYRLTKDLAWHELFLSTTVFQFDTVNAYTYNKHDQREAAFLYARLNEANVTVDSATPDSAASTFTTVPTVDASAQSNARNAFLRRADNLARLTRTTAFGWSRQQPTAPMGWRNGLGAPTATDILRAHALTGQADYLKSGLSGTQFAAGANPSNMVFTTGLGDRSPQKPLISDCRITGQAPPPGITVFGPADFGYYSDYWTLDAIANHTFPGPRQCPTVENYFDIYSYPMGAEFTVQYMVASVYTWGYLAARE